jgi:hypothetical protein
MDADDADLVARAVAMDRAKNRNRATTSTASVCWTKRIRNLSMVVGVDTGVEGDDGNDSDESMWSLPVRTTTALCVCVRAYRVRV